MTMFLKYIGDDNEIDLISEHTYKARKIHDALGDGYAIFDEGEDWYRYGVNYVKENFIEVEETEENIRQAV